MRTKARDAGCAGDGTASMRFAASSLRDDPSDPAPLAPRRLTTAGTRLPAMSGPTEQREKPPKGQ